MIKQKQINKVFQAIRFGLKRVTDICRWADVSEDWYYLKIANDPKFAKQIDIAVIQRKLKWLKIVQKAAPKRWPAAAWILERTHPEDFALRYKAELTGKDEGPIAYKKDDLANMDDKELEELGNKLDAILRPLQSKNPD